MTEENKKVDIEINFKPVQETTLTEEDIDVLIDNGPVQETDTHQYYCALEGHVLRVPVDGEGDGTLDLDNAEIRV